MRCEIDGCGEENVGLVKVPPCSFVPLCQEHLNAWGESPEHAAYADAGLKVRFNLVYRFVRRTKPSVEHASSPQL